ncbi:MAG: PQQ-dependent sugar dehydrogenase [Anaerolineae bacterium]|nr:PQQ-dependent sugar dehydrogenase [Anaerolineae bacterium]
MAGLSSLVVILLLAVPLTARAQEEAPTIDPGAYTLVEVVDGLARPLYVTHAGDGSGRLFVVLQGGAIVVVRDGERLPDPFLDLTDRVSPEARGGGYTERGLLGLAFHPDYAENGRFFVNYTDNRGDTVVAEYAVSADDPDRADPASAKALLTAAQPYGNHNGGHLDFGPDGYLYISLGDGGSGGDPQGNGQNPFTLLGALLRIDVDREGDGGKPYAIPEDNPFADGAAGAPEVWAWGLRNAWRISFDRATGDLYIGDVGQNLWEEIDFQPAGSAGGVNYGWNAYEGTHVYSGEALAGDAAMPIAEYGHDQGVSVTGGYVYRGAALPALQGAYIYGDWGSGKTWAAYRDAAGVWQNTPFIDTGRQIASFGEDEAGELYVVSYDEGAVYRLAAADE